MRLTAVLVGLLLALAAAPATASAWHMQLGLQDDNTLLSAPQTFLQTADSVHARWARVMVTQELWQRDPGSVIRSAQEAKAHGKRVMVSLLAWMTAPTAPQWRRFAIRVAPALAPWVDAWSPMNEPNCFGFMAHGGPTGRTYGRVWDRVAPVLRFVDPTARLVVGDLCPNPDASKIMHWFVRHPHPVRPDVMGVHPYYHGCRFKRRRDGSWRLPDVGAAVRFARRHHMPVWATEWAQFPDVSARCWSRSLAFMRHAGVRKVFIYNTAGPTWDTAMRPHAAQAVAHAGRIS